MCRALMCLIASSMLLGCASGTRPTPAPLPRTPPPALLAPCPQLPPLQVGTLRELVTNHVQVAQAYHRCSQRQGQLSRWVEASNEARPR